MSALSGSAPNAKQRGSALLCKQLSWSPDASRDEEWARRKRHNRVRRGRSRSLTDDDLEDFKACFELGFGFDSPELDPKLTSAFPALEFYAAVNRQYSNLSRSSSSISSDNDSNSTPLPESTTSPLFNTSDDPETVKARLKRWAQVVACSLRHAPKDK